MINAIGSILAVRLLWPLDESTADVGYASHVLVGCTFLRCTSTFSRRVLRIAGFRTRSEN